MFNKLFVTNFQHVIVITFLFMFILRFAWGILHTVLHSEKKLSLFTTAY